MSQTIHGPAMTWIQFVDWIITFVLLIVGLELIKPNLANLMIVLYRYFIQGEGISR